MNPENPNYIINNYTPTIFPHEAESSKIAQNMAANLATQNDLEWTKYNL